jgi:uncharacterized lipoprotein YbaY
MKSAKIAILLLSAVLLAACEQKQPYQPPVPETDKDHAQNRLFEPERQALDKAKGVEGTVEQGAESRKQEIDKQAN